MLHHDIRGILFRDAAAIQKLEALSALPVDLSHSLHKYIHLHGLIQSDRIDALLLVRGDPDLTVALDHYAAVRAVLDVLLHHDRIAGALSVLRDHPQVGIELSQRLLVRIGRSICALQRERLPGMGFLNMLHELSGCHPRVDLYETAPDRAQLLSLRRYAPLKDVGAVSDLDQRGGIQLLLIHLGKERKIVVLREYLNVRGTLHIVHEIAVHLAKAYLSVMILIRRSLPVFVTRASHKLQRELSGSCLLAFVAILIGRARHQHLVVIVSEVVPCSVAALDPRSTARAALEYLGHRIDEFLRAALYAPARRRTRHGIHKLLSDKPSGVAAVQYDHLGARHLVQSFLQLVDADPACGGLLLAPAPQCLVHCADIGAVIALHIVAVTAVVQIRHVLVRAVCEGPGDAVQKFPLLEILLRPHCGESLPAKAGLPEKSAHHADIILRPLEIHLGLSVVLIADQQSPVLHAVLQADAVSLLPRIL